MVEVCFELPAFAKVVLHATKYPALGINGVLLRKAGKGKVAGGGAEGGQEVGVKHVTFHDAVPLLHMSKYLTPTMEIALAQVNSVISDYNQNLKKLGETSNVAGSWFIVLRFNYYYSLNLESLLNLVINGLPFVFCR